MRTVGIVGDNIEALVDAFNRLPYSGVKCITGRSVPADALIVQDAKPALARALASLSEGAFLIVNTDKKEILPFITRDRRAFRLISYGFNNKACITASSTIGGTIKACVQRGFMTMTGKMCEPGEFDFPLSTIEADAALGFAAACLACGAL